MRRDLHEKFKVRLIFISLLIRIGVLQYDLENNFIAEYNSISEASKKTLTRCSCITQCINPKYNRTTANNFIWKKQKIVG